MSTCKELPELLCHSTSIGFGNDSVIFGENRLGVIFMQNKRNNDQFKNDFVFFFSSLKFTKHCVDCPTLRLTKFVIKPIDEIHDNRRRVTPHCWEYEK